MNLAGPKTTIEMTLAGLPRSFGENVVENFCKVYGNVEKALVYRDRAGCSLGIASVFFYDNDSITKACNGLDGLEILGTKVSARFA